MNLLFKTMMVNSKAWSLLKNRVFLLIDLIL